MQNYDRDAVMGLVSREIEDRGFGVQAALARSVHVSTATVGKWKKRETCPTRRHWRGIERFFGWPENRLAKAAGLKPAAVGDVEAAIMRDPDLDLTEKEALVVHLRTYKNRSRRDTTHGYRSQANAVSEGQQRAP